MKVSGRGDLFLADDANEIHLITLEGDSITVNGRNVLAFDSTLTWDISRVESASILAGDLFDTVFTGTGQVAITAHGTPVVLTVDAPTFADMQRPLRGPRRSPPACGGRLEPERSSGAAPGRRSSSPSPDLGSWWSRQAKDGSSRTTRTDGLSP